jgi:hypothetical protein
MVRRDAGFDCDRGVLRPLGIGKIVFVEKYAAEIVKLGIAAPGKLECLVLFLLGIA